uniref:Ribosomal protein L23 n=1 Tax=Cryptomonas sp. CCAC 1634B TaxID=2051848 RepID=A0A679C9S3_9CRYP|nr:ribosomal protein L23 [Cryptomonas sp. CCAC 1634B]
MDLRKLAEIVRYPILTDKSTKLLTLGQYCFAVDSRVDKCTIKLAIQQLFKVTVVSVNTNCALCTHSKRNTRVKAKRRYKKAIIKVLPGNSIPLYSES